MKKLIISVFAIIGIAAQANAGLHIEPYLGYAKTETNDDSEATGMYYGARLGGSTLGFIYGAEYRAAGLTLEDSGGGGDADLDTTDLGAFVGYEFPVLIRAYLSYFFKSEAEVEGMGDLEGSGMVVGVGYTGLPFVAINLEMINYTYDELDGASIPDEDIDGFGLNISIPLP